MFKIGLWAESSLQDEKPAPHSCSLDVTVRTDSGEGLCPPLSFVDDIINLIFPGGFNAPA